MRPAAFLLILACVALGAMGQLSLKHGIAQAGAPPRLEVRTLLRVGMEPFVLLGVGLYAVSMLVWLMVLARAPLSVAYPMLSLGYVVVALLSHWLFAEPLTALKLAGILLIFFGVTLLAQG